MDKLLIEVQLLALELDNQKLYTGHLHKDQLRNMQYKNQVKIDVIRSKLASNRQEVI